MSLKSLDLKISYNSDKDDILNDFYIPALSQAILYKRIAGYFSSSSFALAARGLSKFVLNGGHMQLLVNHTLQQGDKEVIEKINSDSTYVTKALEETIESWDLENKIIRNHVEVFGWMLAKKLIDLKIAITSEPDIFHQKVGIMIDKDGNKLSFSGSNNETSLGWKLNIEEFKVFKGWIPEQNEYLLQDELKFSTFWQGQAKRFVVVDVPTAVKEKLISIAPRNIEDIVIDDGKINEVFTFENPTPQVTGKKRFIELRDFQRDAVDKWVENSYRGILSMATGTGKTFAALSCLSNALSKYSKLLCVISVPYNHLLAQWKGELSKVQEEGSETDFKNIISLREREKIVIGSSNYKWKKELINKLYDLNNGNLDRLIVFTTDDTLASKFLLENLAKANVARLLIADEMHGLGSPERRKGLIGEFSLRLGLSATPKRWMDEEGSDAIFKFFGDVVFEFSIKQAINTINPSTGKGYLTPYNYLPYFIDLTEREMEEYITLSKKIAQTFSYKDSNLTSEKKYEQLLYKRANILKTAENKIVELPKILADIKNLNGYIKDVLIYCNDLKQLDLVTKVLYDLGIRNHKFTGGEGIKKEERFDNKTEREFILEKFQSGFYQVIVAIKCLDEGVDIPSAKYGVILASSTNPREFIQRRGRLLRYHKDKNMSYIYDTLVIPPIMEGVGDDFVKQERAIYRKEVLRYNEFAEIADNSSLCLLKLIQIEEEKGIFK